MEKRVALVTDVTGFIGLPSSRALTENGLVVYGTHESFSNEAARRDYESACPGARSLPPASAEELLANILEEQGQLDVLVNNDTHPAYHAPVEKADTAELRESFEKLFFKAFTNTRAVVPHMKARKQGRIIFVTSCAPLNGLVNFSVYTAARGATNALSRSLALELARDNIQVNTVAPNFVQNPEYYPPSLINDPEKGPKILKKIPMGRLGTPEEAASAVAYLADPKAAFVTGQLIAMAGGWAVGR